MIMQIYNTLTRKKELFKPLHEGKVTIYACGPTVYDYVHIGNARPFITFDVLRRQLEREGYVITTPAKGTFVSSRYAERLRELGLMKLSEQIDDLVYLARAMNVSSAQLAELVAEHYAYVTSNPDNMAKLNKFLQQRKHRY